MFYVLRMFAGVPASLSAFAVAFAGVPASLSAFAVAFAGVPASLSAFAVAFAGVPQVSRHLPWRLREFRKSLGICRGVSADTGEFGRVRAFAPSGGRCIRAAQFRRPGVSPPQGFAAQGFDLGGRNPWAAKTWVAKPLGGAGTGERPRVASNLSISSPHQMVRRDP